MASALFVKDSVRKTQNNICRTLWADPRPAPASSVAYGVIAIAGLVLAGFAKTAHAFEPSRPIQFIVPAGTGGGADQMARVIQGIIAKYSLSRQPIVVVNKAGGAGAEGFLEAKESRRQSPHTRH